MTARPGRRAYAVVCGAAAVGLLLTTSGCGSSRDYAVPGDACGVPVKSGALSPLLPDGDQLTQQKEHVGGPESPRCRISVDSSLTVYIKGDVIDRTTDPVKVNEHTFVALGNPRPVSGIGERAEIADSGALATVACTYQGKPMQYVGYVELLKDKPEKTIERRKALVTFLRSYFPGAVKKQGCT